MHEPDFWTCCAEAMEMSIEGNRLIAAEIGDVISRLWRRVGHSLHRLVHEPANHRHLPPI